MNKKMMLLALAAVSAAMFALPAMASAGTWHFEKAGGIKVNTFTGTGGVSEWTTTNGLTLKATSTTVHGEFETTTTGTITLTFHGFVGLFGVHCTTAGQPTGTVVSTKLTFHLVHLEPAKNKPGILITPNHTTGNFLHFECGGVKQTWAGNGLLGELVAPSPPCGAETTAPEFKFQRSTTLGLGHQTWTQVTTTGTVYDLTNAGSTMSIDASAKLVTEKGKVNCT